MAHNLKLFDFRRKANSIPTRFHDLRDFRRFVKYNSTRDIYTGQRLRDTQKKKRPGCATTIRSLRYLISSGVNFNVQSPNDCISLESKVGTHLEFQNTLNFFIASPWNVCYASTASKIATAYQTTLQWSGSKRVRTSQDKVQILHQFGFKEHIQKPLPR